MGVRNRVMYLLSNSWHALASREPHFWEGIDSQTVVRSISRWLVSIRGPCLFDWLSVDWLGLTIYLSFSFSVCVWGTFLSILLAILWLWHPSVVPSKLEGSRRWDKFNDAVMKHANLLTWRVYFCVFLRNSARKFIPFLFHSLSYFRRNKQSSFSQKCLWSPQDLAITLE